MAVIFEVLLYKIMINRVNIFKIGIFYLKIERGVRDKIPKYRDFYISLLKLMIMNIIQEYYSIIFLRLRARFINIYFFLPRPDLSILDVYNLSNPYCVKNLPLKFC